MKQTAIDLIISKLEELRGQSARKELQGRNAEYRIALYETILICEELKELEKQQMFEFTKKIHVIGQQTEDFYTEEFEKYYNETYKSNE